MEQPHTNFDFAEHEKSAIATYLKVQPFYKDFAGVIGRILEECLGKRRVKVQSVQYRAKDPESLGRKAASPSDLDPTKPKYDDPLTQITDLAAVRVITYFPATINQVDQLLSEEFDVIERSDKSAELIDQERFGYQSVHYLVRLQFERSRLAEYERFAAAVAEVQVRTVLQHAWAEIEHDIQYKSAVSIPTEIRRRFMALAGMLEIADREFQAIQDADRRLTDDARKSVERGDLAGVEITPDALKSFLDKRLGPDARIRDYDWQTRLLKKLGFKDLRQVERAISDLSDSHLSKITWGNRQGQSTRFELMLLAALGERFIERHFWNELDWFRVSSTTRLNTFREKGVKVGTYDPLKQDGEPNADGPATKADLPAPNPPKAVAE